MGILKEVEDRASIAEVCRKYAVSEQTVLISSDCEYDNVSNLNRPREFRLNIGVSKQTFQLRRINKIFVGFIIAIIIGAQILVAQDLTPTPHAGVLDAEQVAIMGVEANAEWKTFSPYVREFDGVEMVLVPSGCFMLGSEQGDNDEKPIEEVCVDKPFWMDRTEVTHRDFVRLGGVRGTGDCFYGENRPIECITWFQARDFCELRDGRLPSEAEWEYAARGPDEWVYPWGNEWVADNVIWNRSFSQGTAKVGSRPAGSSWVGALDLSGNVWEWTSSLYEPYPYDAADGREADTGNRTDIQRVLRGGSWSSSSSQVLRSANRKQFNPSRRDADVGFRCVRSY